MNESLLAPNTLGVLYHFSGAAFLSLVPSTIAGAATGALVSTIAKRSIVQFVPGAIRAVAPAAVVGVVLSVCAGTLQILFCKPGKAAVDVPVWAMWTETIIILLGGCVGALFGLRLHRCRTARRLLLSFVGWIIAGATIGALANFWHGVDGYYVIETNARLIRAITVGLVSGGIAAVLWRALVEVFRQRVETPLETANAA